MKSIGRMSVVAAALVATVIAQPAHCQSVAPATAAAEAGSATAATPAPPSIMVLFDASGSMWGELGGGRATKLVIAREALRASLAKHATTARVGLATFPSRRRSDCAAAELIKGPEPMRLEALMPHLERLNPRGKGPLVKGLRLAAEELSAATGPAAIVIVQDGADNCGQDACAAMQAIHAAQPRLVAHVVGLGLEDAAISSASCVAVVSGGRFLNAGNAESARNAIDTIVALASRTTAPAPPVIARRAVEVPAGKVAEPADPARTWPKSRDTGPPGLRPFAMLRAKAELLETPLRWQITRLAAHPEPIGETIAAAPEMALAAGNYAITAVLGLVERTHRVQVGRTGAAAVPFALEAGWLQLSVLDKAGGAAEHGAMVRLQPLDDSARSGQARRGRLTDRDASMPPATAAPMLLAPSQWMRPLLLPAGRWRLVATLGKAERAVEFAIEAGTTTPVEVILELGRLVIAATRLDGSPADELVLALHEDDADAASGRREVARLTGAVNELALPAGTYYLVARLGRAESRESISVSSGSITRVAMAIPVSELELTASVAGRPVPDELRREWLIESLDTPSMEPVRSRGLQPKVVLTAGRYRVTSRIDHANALAVAEVTVVAGKSRLLTMMHRAGQARLIADPGTGVLASSGAFWEVRDASGREVWSGMHRSATLWLQVGRYSVRALAKGRRIEKSVTVVDGEMVDVRLTRP